MKINKTVKLGTQTLFELLIIISIVASLSGCSSVDGSHELEEEFRSFELDNVKSVLIDVRMSAGELDVAGGAEELLATRFVYDSTQIKPEVEYQLLEDKGYVTIKQNNLGSFPLYDATCLTALHINDDVPTTLRIDLGTNESNIRLGGTCIDRADINMGSGDLMLDLTGDWNCDLNVRINGGGGKLKIRVPSNTGTVIDFYGSIGEVSAIGLREKVNLYVNDTYGVSDVLLMIHVNGQYGSTIVELVSD